jgi:N-acetylglucosamine-6-phosphate deacetylase
MEADVAQDTSAANSKKIHDDNYAKIVAQSSSNAARAASVPSPVGRIEPGMDVNAMQGTANGVVPNRVTLTRIG